MNLVCARLFYTRFGKLQLQLMFWQIQDFRPLCDT